VLNRTEEVVALEQASSRQFNFRAMLSLILGVSRLKDGFSNKSLEIITPYVERTMSDIFRTSSTDSIDFALPALWKMIDIATFFTPTYVPTDDKIKYELAKSCTKWLRDLIFLKLKFTEYNVKIEITDSKIFFIKLRRDEISNLRDVRK
jgi:hypothetical protein